MIGIDLNAQNELNGIYEETTYAFVESSDPGSEYEGGKILFISKGSSPEQARDRWLSTYYVDGKLIKKLPTWYKDIKSIFVLTLNSYQSITGNTAPDAFSLQLALPEMNIK